MNEKCKNHPHKMATHTINNLRLFDTDYGLCESCYQTLSHQISIDIHSPVRVKLVIGRCESCKQLDEDMPLKDGMFLCKKCFGVFSAINNGAFDRAKFSDDFGDELEV